MSTTPSNWSVVVAGAWNLAILTPDGIRKRLLQLPEQSPINIEVAVDRPGVFRVLSDQLAIAPSARALDIAVLSPDQRTLRTATEVAIRAVEALRDTPFAGVGVNMHQEITPITESIEVFCTSPLDDVLSDAGETIRSRLTRRTLSLDVGVLNIELIRPSDRAAEVGFNFHCDATSPDACITWLKRVDFFHDKMTVLLEKLMGDAK